MCKIRTTYGRFRANLNVPPYSTNSRKKPALEPGLPTASRTFANDHEMFRQYHGDSRGSDSKRRPNPDRRP